MIHRKSVARLFLLMIVLYIIGLAALAFAADTTLPHRVELVNCGWAKDLPESCRADERCCRLLDLVEPAAGDDGAPAADQGRFEAIDNPGDQADIVIQTIDYE